MFVAAAVLAGCASRAPVAVRDGNGMAPPPAAQVPGAAQAGTHIVKPGETLLAISRQYGVSVNELVGWNRLADPNRLEVGQVLRVSPATVADQGGAVAVPIPIPSDSAVTVPVTPQSGTAGIKQEPKGGRVPYSDEAWARMRKPDDAGGPAPEARVETTPATQPADAEWLWPASGKILARFNEATNKGVDIAGNPGDPVVASAAGRVVYAGSGLRGYGKLVIIKHNQEYNSVYAHNQKLLVKEDDQVTKGQKIAELGSSDADRPKLHFEIRKQGRPVDPMKFLSAR